VQVPAALITALNGLVVVFVVSSEIFRRKNARRRAIRALEEKLAVATQEEASELEGSG
jgi:simple sugar transport system permease protein